MSLIDKIKRATNLGHARPTYPVVDGIDVSHHQSYVNWKEYKSRGFEFCFIKATQGTTFKDPMYYKHKDASGALGFLRGNYHFVDLASNPIEQANYFVRNTVPLELGYVCDWERSDGSTRDHQIDHGLEFLRRLEELTKRVPIIYGGHVIRDLNLGDEFKRYPLWECHYEVSKPKPILPWNENFTFWQYTERLDGKTLDGNYFKGTLEELKTKFVKGNM